MRAVSSLGYTTVNLKVALYGGSFMQGNIFSALSKCRYVAIKVLKHEKSDELPSLSLARYVKIDPRESSCSASGFAHISN